MHLLAAQPGQITDGREAVDLCQTPGDVVILSAADSELLCLSEAYSQKKNQSFVLRLANLMQLTHNLSVDLYVENIISKAKLVIIRIIGGVSYWPYGIEQISGICNKCGVALAVVPGDDQPDIELMDYSTLSKKEVERIWRYLLHGGLQNSYSLLNYCGALLDDKVEWSEPKPLLRAGIYWPGLDNPIIEDIQKRWALDTSTIGIVFYRALVQSGNLKPVDALIAALGERGLNSLPIYVSSLKDEFSSKLVTDLFFKTNPEVILNTTGFAVSSPENSDTVSPLNISNCPIIQVVFSGGSQDSWRNTMMGLSSRDIAMNVALPEVDGRLLSRAVSFKAEARFDRKTECSVISYEPLSDRIDFTADLALKWAQLRRAPPEKRRLVLVLANYPNKDGRIGNGVGLDTPASIIRVLEALKAARYHLTDTPNSTEHLMKMLTEGPTNSKEKACLKGGTPFNLEDYKYHFRQLPNSIQAEVLDRWGRPETDPFVDAHKFILPIHAFGNILVAVQPARGYNIDPKSTYHDPALVPPHGYLAFYIWIANYFAAHAVVHIGKHGNLEWLPGKSLALSKVCYPEAALGPMPNLYPFIVNDPGEGSQAKRRSAAVIIDHLTPPMTRAETYGPLKDLEALIDEYYQAASLDPRRLKMLSNQMVDLMEGLKIDKDCGINSEDSYNEKLQKLDSYLCELKELQIKDGLHVFGTSPTRSLMNELLVALLRSPRGGQNKESESLHRALAIDLKLGEFDPLNCSMATRWLGPWPIELRNISPDAIWRSNGDTVERLELLASKLVSGELEMNPNWVKTKSILRYLETFLKPAVLSCAGSEIQGLLAGLDGHFVEPGPSGAPTRGRPEVLPTGRNFYSVDTRIVPTPTAWHLGWKSASLVLDRYRQENGEWPRTLALSAWGTANMRTGGDDIAQAMAFIGVKPDWEPISGRIVGFQILPLTVLDRPRIDITFRISGFFRDAFPFQIELLDSAIRAVGALAEPAELNPLANSFKGDLQAMMAEGQDPKMAEHRVGVRIFGSKPGAYGAGLQTLIDEEIWESDFDFAESYLKWGGFAYGRGIDGRAETDLFKNRLSNIQVVLHNQDNREHDILDSDDYYQFQGGLAATVRQFSGVQPTVYHGDHSRPETPKILTLAEEISRIVRGRVINPKWIKGMMRHGYKGAFEMAATVDYLFAFAATARCVSDHHFDAVFDAYIDDEEVLDFLKKYNPNALIDIAKRLLEAQTRNLWRPSRNSVVEQLDYLATKR